VNGQAWQVWHTAHGLLHCTGPASAISALTIVGALPKDANSFTMSIKHLRFESGLIDGPAKAAPKGTARTGSSD
jgi:hypothetical protein